MSGFHRDLRYSQSKDTLLERVYRELFPGFERMEEVPLEKQKVWGDRRVVIDSRSIYVEEKVDRGDIPNVVLELLDGENEGCIPRMMSTFKGQHLLYVFPERGVAHLFPWPELKHVLEECLAGWIDDAEQHHGTDDRNDNDFRWGFMLEGKDRDKPMTNLFVSEFFLTHTVPGARTVTWPLSSGSP